MPMASFMAMVELWEKMGFVFLSMEEASEIVLNSKKINHPWIHITFDDGFRNNFTAAYPYLKAKKIPFTIFLSTRNVIEHKRFDNYIIACAVQHTDNLARLKEISTLIGRNYDFADRSELGKDTIGFFKYLPVNEKLKFMDMISSCLSEAEWETLNEMYDSEDVLSPEEVSILGRDPLVHLGSHGHNHYILSTLNEEQINKELNESRMHITSLTGKEPFTYCYPNGKKNDFPEGIDKLCKSNHYKLAFTTAKKKIPD